MNEPQIGGKKPVLVTLSKGESYFWCACGRSNTQPFCDGSHKGTSFRPVRVFHNVDEEVLLCACKRTRRPPYCDGSHNQLKAGDADGRRSRATAPLKPPLDGRASLDGGCFVLTPGDGEAAISGGWRVTPLIGPADGAEHLGQYLLEPRDAAEAISFGKSEVVLFVAEGSGEIAIGDWTAAFVRETAICIRPGEAFRVSPVAARAKIFATVCPASAPRPMQEHSSFDARFSDRLSVTARSARHATGDRFYQVLIDETKGAEGITQFIGEIPRSRAEPHRHLYEEALLFLSGEGFLHTENARAAVRPGDIAFLPKKQVHSVECISPEGMRLAGAFYPSGSPAINY